MQSRPARLLRVQSPTVRAALANAWRKDLGPRLRFFPYQVWTLLGRPVRYGRTQRMHLNPHDRVVSYSVAVQGSFCPGEIDLLRRLVRPGWTVVDVGANIGCHTLALAEAVGPQGRVLAIEPEPGNVALLRRNVALNRLGNVVVAAVAVGERDGTIELTVSHANSGLHSVASSNVTPWGKAHSVQVPLRTLDGIAAEGGLAKVDLVKMDVQGAEWMAVKGASKLLAGRPLLYTEYGPGFIRATGGDPHAFLDSLSAMGYEAYLADKDGRLTRTSFPELARFEGKEVDLLLAVPGTGLPDVAT